MQSTATDSNENAQEQDQQLRAQVELLRSPDGDLATSNSTAADVPPLSPDQSNGYDGHAAASSDALRALKRRAEADSHIHPDLRAAARRAASTATSMMPMGPPAGAGHSPDSSNQSVSPNPALQPNATTHHTNAHLAPAPPPDMSDNPDLTPDGRSRPKRELSQSKRAAQNRAAQRAFRQRKETYIRQLEQENKSFREMEKSWKDMSTENHLLREYVLTLQSRLLEVGGRFPVPPHELRMHQQQQPAGEAQPEPEPEPEQPQLQHHHEDDTGTINDGTPLEYVARAVANIAAQEGHHYTTEDHEMKEDTTEDTRTAEEINQHLQAQEQEPESEIAESA